MTISAQPDWATGLIDLLDQQRSIYQQLVELSVRQSQLVQAGDAEPLLSLLTQRQRLIDDLTQLNGSIEPYKQNWPALWARLDAASQASIQTLIDSVQKLLDRILAQDEQDRQQLSAQRDRTGAQLKQVNAGSAVNRAYGKALGGGAGSDGNNRYTDDRG